MKQLGVACDSVDVTASVNLLEITRTLNNTKEHAEDLSMEITVRDTV